jgi:Domain of unknown function (DUF4403)
VPVGWNQRARDVPGRCQTIPDGGRLSTDERADAIVAPSHSPERTVSRRHARILVSTVALLMGCATLDVPAPTPGGSSPVPLPPPVASSIAVPLSGTLGLTELERVANDLVPWGERPGVGEGGWREVELAPGTRLRFAFWRDDVRMAGENGQVQATIRLYFRLVIQLPASGVAAALECGTATTPGTATLRLVTTFTWHPEWRLVPSTIVDAPEVTSGCPASLPGLDPGTLLAERLRRQLTALAGRMDSHLAERTDFRAAAVQYWTRLAEPIALGEQAVLHLNPRAASAAPVVFSREAVATEVALVAYPEVVLGHERAAGPPRAISPLPPLGTGAAADRFVVNLRALVPFAATTAAIRARAPLPRVQQVLDRDVRITDLRAYGSNRDVVLAVSLDQPVQGTVYLTGRPAYRAGRLTLEAFDFQTESREALVRAASSLLHVTFRDQLAEQLN